MQYLKLIQMLQSIHIWLYFGPQCGNFEQNFVQLNIWLQFRNLIKSRDAQYNKFLWDEIINLGSSGYTVVSFHK